MKSVIKVLLYIHLSSLTLSALTILDIFICYSGSSYLKPIAEEDKLRNLARDGRENVKERIKETRENVKEKMQV